MFLLKKVVGTLVDPAVVGLLLLLAGVLLLLARRREWVGRILVLLATVVLISSSLWPVANRLVVPLEDDYAAIMPAELEGVRVIAVLGGGHTEHAGQPPVQWLTPGALERLVEGIRLYHLLENGRMVFTGWSGSESTPHAAVMARAAVSLGVPIERIVQLPRPRDTAEELSAVAGIVGADPFVLVTSASHLPRAMEAADRRGLRAIPAPAHFRSRAQNGYRAWIPTPDAMAATAAALHEYVGRWGYGLIDR